MSKSIKSKGTARIFVRLRSTKLPQGIQQISYRKLRMLNNAVSLDDLRVPPRNGWRSLAPIGQGSTASGSMISGGFALNGSMEMLIT